MKKIVLIIALIWTAVSSAQEHSGFNYKEDKENVVASAIDGLWRTKNAQTKEQMTFRKDLSVLKRVAEHRKIFEKFTIYHAGYMEIVSDESYKNGTYPFLLIETNGNPHLAFFREKEGNPVGSIQSFILFIAIGEEKAEDRLFVGGKRNDQPFTEFERVE
ncbi:MAG: hypothetical protein Q4A09_08515 [Capnocytophaga felis]|nr:hypothetical protein [Capnocytophaga felis]